MRLKFVNDAGEPSKLSNENVDKFTGTNIREKSTLVYILSCLAQFRIHVWVPVI